MYTPRYLQRTKKMQIANFRMQLTFFFRFDNFFLKFLKVEI